MAESRVLTKPRMSTPARRQSMLVPVAYSESVLPSLRLARSSRIIRRIGVVLFVFLVFTIILMAFAPWQQNVKGSGTVLAYSPDQRPQVIESPLKGMISSWSSDIYENAKVKKGQRIAEVQDLDELYKDQLDRKLLISKEAEGSARAMLANYQSALVASKKIVGSYEGKYAAYQKVKDETIAAQDAFVTMAEKKVQAEKEQLLEYQAAIPQLEEEYKRMETLQKLDTVSLQRLQEVERKFKEANAKVSRGQAYVEAAESELMGKKSERSAKIQKALADIDTAKAELDKAIGEVSKAEGDIAKAEQELNKATKEIVDMEVNVARQKRGLIEAPFDGYIVQITPNLQTSVLKEGDPICTIVPETTDRSVQIYVHGNDAPLVKAGRHVRLQFEGWPAIQFAGWPSVAVGTFGGVVVSIDSTDDGKGKFRVLIRPDDESDRWPEDEDRFLRQGVRANAWVLLDQVPLWYEVWRQLNGFPPVVSVEDDNAKESKSKPPKLPKQ